MAKDKYSVLSTIGSVKKPKHKAGDIVELDPEHSETKRFLKAQAIAPYVEPKAPVSNDSAELEAKVKELEGEIDVLTVDLNKSEKNGADLAKALEESQAEVAKLKTELEAAKKPAKVAK